MYHIASESQYQKEYYVNGLNPLNEFTSHSPKCDTLPKFIDYLKGPKGRHVNAEESYLYTFSHLMNMARGDWRFGRIESPNAISFLVNSSYIEKASKEAGGFSRSQTCRHMQQLNVPGVITCNVIYHSRLLKGGQKITKPVWKVIIQRKALKNPEFYQQRILAMAFENRKDSVSSNRVYTICQNLKLLKERNILRKEEIDRLNNTNHAFTYNNRTSQNDSIIKRSLFLESNDKEKEYLNDKYHAPGDIIYRLEGENNIQKECN